MWYVLKFINLYVVVIKLLIQIIVMQDASGVSSWVDGECAD